MSVNAVASTIYSGSRTVVVDIGSTPISAPWLARTTYLLNKGGRATAVLAQTDQPTASVMLEPVPYTTQAHTALPSPTASTDLLAPTSEATMAAPKTAPSSTTLTLRPQVPAGTIAAIGAVTGIAILIALLFYFRWRIKRYRLRPKDQMQTLRTTPRTWPLAYGVPSWEKLAKDAEKYYAGFYKSTMTSVEENGSGLCLESMQIGDRRSITELRERYERLLQRSQQSSDTGWESSDTHTTSPAIYLPPQKAITRAQSDPPASILKRPPLTETTTTPASKMKNEDEQGSQAVPAPGFPAIVKKGVRFGVNQIREFGLSPWVGHESESSAT